MRTPFIAVASMIGPLVSSAIIFRSSSRAARISIVSIAMSVILSAAVAMPVICHNGTESVMLD